MKLDRILQDSAIKGTHNMGTIMTLFDIFMLVSLTFQITLVINLHYICLNSSFLLPIVI